jgi:hypothetical protein
LNRKIQLEPVQIEKPLELELPGTCSPFMKGLVEKLLDKNAVTRPDALTLLCIDNIYNEAIKIQRKLAEVDREKGNQL